MLYDGAIRFLRQADALIEEGAWPQAIERIRRTQAILDELLCTLNMDAGDLSGRLESIYVFCSSHLRDARLRKDGARVRQVVRLRGELRDAWPEISCRHGPRALRGPRALAESERTLALDG